MKTTFLNFKVSRKVIFKNIVLTIVFLIWLYTVVQAIINPSQFDALN